MANWDESTEVAPTIIDAWFGQPDFRTYTAPTLMVNDEIEVYYETREPGTVSCYIDGELQKSERIADNSITPDNTYINKFMIKVPESVLDRTVTITVRGDNAKFLPLMCAGTGPGRVIAILPTPGHGKVPATGEIDAKIWFEQQTTPGVIERIGVKTPFDVHFMLGNTTAGTLLIEVMIDNEHYRWYTVSIPEGFERKEYVVPVVINEPGDYLISLRLGRNVNDEIEIDGETDISRIVVDSSYSSPTSTGLTLAGYTIPMPYVVAVGAVGLYALLRR